MLFDRIAQMVSIFGAMNIYLAILSESVPISRTKIVDSKTEVLPKVKGRDVSDKVVALELDTQETGYLPPAYQATDSDYGYDAGKNTFGKQASDWSLYDQGKFA